MKILIVITQGYTGGAQMSVLNLARELKSRGHKVAIGLGSGDFLPDELNKENIEYHRFQWLRRTHNPLAALFFIFEMRKFLKINNYEVVHFNSSNSLPGAIGAKFCDKRIKTIFTFRGMSMLDEHHQIFFIFKKLYFLYFKFFLIFIDKPVFVSRENLSKARDMKLVDRGDLVHNGLHPDKLKFYSKEEARKLLKQFHINIEDKYVIGSIGRLVYVKNYGFLIDIFEEIIKIKPEAVIVIVGDGDKKEILREAVKARGFENKIFFIGGINNASKFIKAFDIFVLPSRYEGLSITLIESLMAGIPILASDVGGNREIFACEDELYELNNSEEFLSKFKRLQYKETIEQVMERNKKQAGKFHIDNTVNGYEEVYFN